MCTIYKIWRTSRCSWFSSKGTKKQGTDVAVIMPKYQDIPAHLLANIKKKRYFYVPVGWRNQYCGIEELEVEGITFYFIDNEWYFKRSGLYGYGDDGERYAFFNRAVLESLPYLDNYPDVIHCHDWHTAMIPFLLNVDYKWKKSTAILKLFLPYIIFSFKEYYQERFLVIYLM